MALHNGHDEKIQGEKPMAIVIHGGGIGLGIVRSLGEAGIKCIVLYNSDEEIAIHSKYVVEKVHIKNFLDKDEIRDVLLANADRWKGSILMASNDEQLFAVSYYRKQLARHYIIPLASHKYIQMLLDKSLTYKLAERAGIDYPKTHYPKSMKDAMKLKDKLMFPCLVKPCERHWFYEAFQEKLFEVKTFEEMVEKFRLCLDRKIEVMITEKIPGDDMHLFLCKMYIDSTGQTDFAFIMQKLRQAPPNYGVGRVVRSVVNNDVKMLGKKLIEHMPGFVGVIQPEFKYDSRDGKYKLMEINARPTLFLSLEKKLGIDIPLMIYKDYVENTRWKVDRYRTNIYWIHLYFDLFNIFSKRRKLEHYSFWQYIKPYFMEKAWCIESWRDPKPMIKHWQIKFSDYRRWLAKKMKTAFTSGPTVPVASPAD